MKIKLITVIVLLLMLGCKSKNEVALFNKDKLKPVSIKKVRFEYKIVPHDRVSISTYKRPELSTLNMQNPSAERGAIVDGAGYLKIPLVGNIKVSGLTEKRAAKKLERALRAYLKYPEVNLEVMNKRAYIIGEVKKPGEIALVNDQLRLIEAISKAGDFTDYANRKSILVLKVNGNVVIPKIINLVDNNSIALANMIIKPNDIVYVMPSSMKRFNLNVNNTSPILNLIKDTLGTFVNIQYLKG